MTIDEKLSIEEIQKIEKRGRRRDIARKIRTVLATAFALYSVKLFYNTFKSIREYNSIDKTIAAEMPPYQVILDNQRYLELKRFHLEQWKEKGVVGNAREQDVKEWNSFKHMIKEYGNQDIDSILENGLRKIDAELNALYKQAEPMRIAAEEIPEIKESRANIELNDNRTLNPFYGLF